MDFRSWTSFCFPTIQRWSTARGKEAWLKIYQELFRWYNLINCDSLNFRNSTLTHPKLRKLDASRCNLDRPGLHGFPSLTHARLTRNAIRILPDRIFARNRQLGFLYLNGNRLETLTASTFEGLVKLQTLDLSANNLEEIHPYTFHENIELKTLNLSYNAFYELPKLTTAAITLDASSNLINRLNENLFANMPRLKSIDLSDNRIQKIPLGLKSTTLRNFDLRANRIVELANDTFLQLTQLRSIDISGYNCFSFFKLILYSNLIILHVCVYVYM